MVPEAYKLQAFMQSHPIAPVRRCSTSCRQPFLHVFTNLRVLQALLLVRTNLAPNRTSAMEDRTGARALPEAYELQAFLQSHFVSSTRFARKPHNGFVTNPRVLQAPLPVAPVRWRIALVRQRSPCLSNYKHDCVCRSTKAAPTM